MNEHEAIGLRVYRPSHGWMSFMAVAGSAMLCGGLWAVATVPSRGGESNSAAGTLFVTGVLLALSGLGLACLLLALRYRVELQGDEIRVQQIFTYRTIRQPQVQGYRTQPGPPSTIKLIPSVSEVRPVSISLCFEADNHFWTWIGAIEDLNANDRIASEEEILSNDEFGATEERRAGRLEEARQAARLLSLSAAALGGWAWLYPHPIGLLAPVIFLIPWAAIELIRRYEGLIRFDVRPNEAYPEVATSLMLPGILLYALIPNHWQIPQWTGALGLGFVVAAVMAALLLRLSSRDAKLSLSAALLFMFLIPYGYGTVILTNCLWEPQATAEFQATVSDKRSKTRSRGPDGHYLTIQPWSAATETEELEVGYALHQATAKGDVVCPLLRPGALGIPWYTIESCAD